MIIEAVIGIDIGKEGGISILSPSGDTLYDALTIPQETTDIVRTINQISSKYTLLHCYVEKQAFMNRSYGNNPYARQGGKAAFTLGHSQGVIEGCLSALLIPYTLVPPKTWQKVLEGVEIPTDIIITQRKTKDTKLKSFLKAKELFPKAPLKTARGKLLDGIADAILIGFWGVTLGGKPTSICYDKVEKPKERKKSKK